jgi:coproporphyrinogen III oxidase-like Fe-S oxidoreductase
MVVRGFNMKSDISEEQQFMLIEDAWELLRTKGYKRISPWTFTRSADEYDCSKAELVSDYIGFGAGSFSTNRTWKVVNPPVDYYLENFNKPGKKALVAGKQKAADQWRSFGRMLADLEIYRKSELGPFINSYIKWLGISGYITNKQLTPKGLFLAHHLMKTIVENLPFPLQDLSQVLNPSEFLTDTKEDENNNWNRFEQVS